jgi:hypothetical protein
VAGAGSRFKRHSAFTEAHPQMSDKRDYGNYVAYFSGM